MHSNKASSPKGVGRALRLVQSRSSSQAPLCAQVLLTRSCQSGTMETPPTPSPETAATVASTIDVSEALKSTLGGFQLPTAAPQTVGSTPKKVYARLSNSPKYAFKSDILAFFESCNLQSHQLVTMYDEKYRQRFIQIEFNDMEAFRQAQRIIVRRGRLGGRYMKLDVDVKSDGDDIHNSVKGFRGQSLLMMQLPTEVTAEDVERFFQGYNLASLSTRFLRVPKDTFPKKPTTTVFSPPVVERRALVKFASPMEASRALRVKQGQFCLNRAIELRFVQ